MTFLKCIIHKIYTFKKRYNNLVDNILSKDFDTSYLEANKLEKTQENMNDRSFLYLKVKT